MNENINMDSNQQYDEYNQQYNQFDPNNQSEQQYNQEYNPMSDMTPSATGGYPEAEDTYNGAQQGGWTNNGMTLTDYIKSFVLAPFYLFSNFFIVVSRDVTLKEVYGLGLMHCLLALFLSLVKRRYEVSFCMVLGYVIFLVLYYYIVPSEEHIAAIRSAIKSLKVLRATNVMDWLQRKLPFIFGSNNQQVRPRQTNDFDSEVYDGDDGVYDNDAGEDYIYQEDQQPITQPTQQPQQQPQKQPQQSSGVLHLGKQDEASTTSQIPALDDEMTGLDLSGSYDINTIPDIPDIEDLDDIDNELLSQPSTTPSSESNAGVPQQFLRARHSPRGSMNNQGNQNLSFEDEDDGI